MNFKPAIFALVFLFGYSVHAQSILVNDPADPQSALSAEDLITDVLVSGSTCVDITLTNLAENPDGTTNASQKSWGYFKSNNSDFPFEEGIVLSSGFAESAQGPNNDPGISDFGVGWGGDVDIKTLLDNEYGGNEVTENATVFEFTFSSSLNEVVFEFIFASEEYEDEWECDPEFRDGFAFLVKGPGIPDDSGAPFGGTNIGSVPGSNNVPVSTASIHSDTFICPGQVQDVDFFPEFYVSNSGANNTNVIQFDGLTASLSTATLAITPNEEYTIKMVIADRGDSSFDSAVFLKAGSFNIGSANLGDDITLDDPEAVCEGNIITLDAGNNPDATYQWFKDGAEIPGETESTLDISETGLYRVELTFASSPDCMIVDEILVEFFPLPVFNLGPDQLVCDNDATILDATVTNPTELSNISYKWFKDGVEITGETNPTLTVAENGDFTAEVVGNGCVSTDTVTIEIVAFEVSIGDVVALCGEDTFTISPEITGTADIANATFLWNTGETTPTITVAVDGTYSVEVSIDNCTISDDAEIIFRNLAALELGDNILKCAGETTTITATIGLDDTFPYQYTWFKDGGELIGETGNSIDIVDEGIYSVELNDRDCIASDAVAVNFYENENCIISQGISPNGDGQNDNLDLQFLNEKSGISKLSVFNRHGRVVYEKIAYVDEWRGQTDGGDVLPVGNYYYVIELQTESPITGWIYLNK